jgi:hypothetical protein
MLGDQLCHAAGQVAAVRAGWASCMASGDSCSCHGDGVRDDRAEQVTEPVVRRLWGLGGA